MKEYVITIQIEYKTMSNCRLQFNNLRGYLEPLDCCGHSIIAIPFKLNLAHKYKGF